MLRKFAAALVAVVIAAGSIFAEEVKGAFVKFADGKLTLTHNWARSAHYRRSSLRAQLTPTSPGCVPQDGGGFSGRQRIWPLACANHRCPAPPLATRRVCGGPG